MYVSQITVFMFVSGDYELVLVSLGHKSGVLRSRCCSMLGNMMKHCDSFYSPLNDRPKLLHALIECLNDEENNVRKVGNAFTYTISQDLLVLELACSRYKALCFVMSTFHP